MNNKILININKTISNSNNSNEIIMLMLNQKIENKQTNHMYSTKKTFQIIGMIGCIGQT